MLTVKYGTLVKNWEFGESENASYLWKDICDASTDLRNSFSWKIVNGRTV